MRDATELGASLYIPATRSDLLEVVRGEKLANVRSVIFCTEDAVNAQDVPLALRNLGAALPSLSYAVHQMRFVRVRNPDVMRQVLASTRVKAIPPGFHCGNPPSSRSRKPAM